jgi:hypothetical protein
VIVETAEIAGTAGNFPVSPISLHFD